MKQFKGRLKLFGLLVKDNDRAAVRIHSFHINFFFFQFLLFRTLVILFESENKYCKTIQSPVYLKQFSFLPYITLYTLVKLENKTQKKNRKFWEKRKKKKERERREV